MAVTLQKGQKVSLKKSDDTPLTNLMVGLGWDVAKKTGLFSGNIDLDASVILLQNGKFVDKKDLVYFGNKKHKSKAVIHQGDNLTGKGDGDDECILIDLNQMPDVYDKLVIVVNIFEMFKKKKHFGMIENSFVRIVDHNNGQEMLRYNLQEDMSDMTAMIFGEVYRHQGEWKFSAVGQGTKDGSVDALAKRYQ